MTKFIWTALAAIVMLSISAAVAETRTAPTGTQGRPPATNYSPNPNVSNPKLGGPTAEQIAKACAQIRSDCAASCKPGAAKTGTCAKPICCKPCGGWYKPLCEQAKVDSGCLNSIGTQAAVQIFKSLMADSCINTCVYQTDQQCAEIDTEMMRIKEEAKKFKVIP